jgi:hypothetical protein
MSIREPGRCALLADLLSLPEDVDSLRWLQTQRAALSAILVWRAVIDRIGPSPKEILASGAMAPARKLRGCVSCGRALTAAAEEATFFRRGFALRLRSRLRPARGALPTMHGVPMAHARAGFDSVIDERGSAYLVRTADWSASSGFRSWEESVRLVCYPAPVGTGELV